MLGAMALRKDNPEMGNPEKPWYTPMVVAFLGDDVPRILGIPQHLLIRDVTTLESRVSCEGESFFTKTLPSLGLAVDIALQGETPLCAPSSFGRYYSKKRGKTALPKFLQALLNRVFLDDGYVRDQPCISTIRLIRQLCNWCKKLEKGYSDESLQRALVDFIQVDQALPSCKDLVLSAGRLLGVARAVVDRIFRNVDPVSTVTPAHGPGAVASGGSAAEKRELPVAYGHLEKVFRPIPWFRSLRDAAEDYARVTQRERRPYGLSRTRFVNKDSRGPRTIGFEPAEYMWCQQALMRLMYRHVENSGWAARGRVNFRNQNVNRELARDWQTWDTLDMSKASDRNSLALFKLLWCNTPLYAWLLASRTPGTVLPDGSTLVYKKFAPMGSAVCFPVQAVTYYALACAALHLAGMPLLLAIRKVFVFGDDLIVPHGHFAVLDEAFSSVGLKFNVEKCCISGRFRESCGLDAYDGQEVTPVRFKKSDMNTDTDVVRLVEHARALHAAGYWSAGESLERSSKAEYRDLFNKFRFPHSNRQDLPFLSWPSHGAGKIKITRSYQVLSARGWAYASKRERANPAFEMMYLREGLTRAGPVGERFWVSNPEDYDTAPSVFERLFTIKDRGSLQMKRFAGVQCDEAPLESPLQKRISRVAETQRPLAWS